MFRAAGALLLRVSGRGSGCLIPAARANGAAAAAEGNRWERSGRSGRSGARVGPHGGSNVALQTVRNYARIVHKKQDPEFTSQLADLSPVLLKKDYAGIELVNNSGDVVRKLLSLEMASHKEKLKVKTGQLIEKVRRTPHDVGSTEVQIAILTAKIRNYQEHLHKHTKDKANKRYMLLAIDQRKKLLKYLRRTRYELFENVCTQLDIQYTFPPKYYRKVTRRWVAKKALCIRVFQEVQKLRAAIRQKEAAAKQRGDGQVKPEETPV
eukprot:gi/632976717/ref/XP_007904951.1/ PREDICTED: 28S ribosomal protein S15, mitochondrial [Callorhinchus milii]